jgi:acyl-coenzyme A synthetase/AMP-(fatty) acid ligase
MIFPALGWGGTLHLISRYRLLDGHALADYFQIHQIDHLKIAPSHYLALLSANPSPSLLPRRTLILGGEALNWTLIERLRQLGASCDIWNHYGPTETTVGVLTYSVQRNLTVDETLPGAQAPQAGIYQRAASVPLGWPLANVRVYVLDPDSNPVPLGMPGELYIGGDQVARGYLGDPVRTALQFVPKNLVHALQERLYRTGDRVRMHSDGAIEFLGRGDSQVKIRGFRVELGEVEVVLGKHPAVAEHAVLLHRDSTGQPYLAAYCTPVTGQTLDRQAVWDHLVKHLPDYMVPAAIVVLEKFPRTLHGKVNRRALPVPDQFDDASSTVANYIAPQTPVEQVLAAIWKEVLNVERVGLNDTFFGLGGHSLLIIRLVSRLNTIFMVNLPVRVVFKAQSLGEMAHELIGVVGDQGRGEEIARLVLWLQDLPEAQVEDLLNKTNVPLSLGELFDE